MSQIILSTLNARYIHASLGLRCILANLGELQSVTTLKEFIIDTRPIDIVEQLLASQPKIIGLGVYIWNIEQSTQVVALLKQVAPDVFVVIGGPEVSYEQPSQAIFQLADYAVSGAGEKCFSDLCQGLLNDERPTGKIIPGNNGNLAELAFPYSLYNDEDIAHRIIYVEASRGCPFKCEFCLSALDKTAKPFDMDLFLKEMALLYQRGTRHFKFIDRTFNLKINHSIRIMKFFRIECSEAFLHFELIPDHLPDALKTEIALFGEGRLQFEIGIQSFNPNVQALISRKQDNDKSANNIFWLRNHSQAHLHTDLIIGLPGEDIESIATGFNKLASLNPHEIQVGILKRLKGTPIIRHTDNFKLRFNPYPPYNILSTDRIDFPSMQRLNRFARYWDMIANSGRFPNTLPLLLAETPFERFLKFSDWLYTSTHQTHKISLSRLFDLLYKGLKEALELTQMQIEHVLLEDFTLAGIKGHPKFLPSNINVGQNNAGVKNAGVKKSTQQQQRTTQRQTRHRSEEG